MKVALVYDRVNKWGGAERVMLALHKLFPDAPLYTSVYHKRRAAWAHVFNVNTSFLQKIPFASSLHEWFAPFMPFAFESFNFDQYDLVISVTSEAAKGVVTKPGTRHICYCLTPTRYLWSGYKQYFSNTLFRFFVKPIIWYLRSWDLVAAQRPDSYIAISKEVQKRIKQYYGRDAKVVYPGANTAFSLEAPSVKLPKKGHFLIVSRLVGYKRIDIAVRAFNKLNLPLKIVGIGSEESKLRAMAHSNIEFLGSLTDVELVEYYKGCLALIFPGKEDFGLVIVEAGAFGKPVIAFRGGGALETVVEKKTGIFFDQQTESSLIEAVKQFEKMSFDPKDAKKQAEKFSQERFEKEFFAIV